MSGEAQLSLQSLFEAGSAKAKATARAARRAAKGAETSRASVALEPLTAREVCVLDELAIRGPDTADRIGERLRRHGDARVSRWGPQTMSSVCNRLLHKRRIMRRKKRKNMSGRMAWVWELRGDDDGDE